MGSRIHVGISTADAAAGAARMAEVLRLGFTELTVCGPRPQEDPVVPWLDAPFGDDSTRRNALLAEILPRIDRDDLVVFLSADQRPDLSTANEFLRMFDADNRIGIAAGRGHVLEVTAHRVGAAGHPYRTAPVDVVDGTGPVWIRADAARDIGELDPMLGDLAIYDYCIRLADEGWRSFVVSSAGARAAALSPTPNWQPHDATARRAASKWIRLGLIDEEGFVRHREPVLYPSPRLRDDVETRIGYRVGRGEWAHAAWDLAELAAAAHLDSAFPRPITPTLVALLAAHAERARDAGRTTDAAVLDRLRERLLAERRKRADRLVTAIRPGGGIEELSRSASLADWEEPSFHDAHQQVQVARRLIAGSEFGASDSSAAHPLDWYGRTTPQWQSAAVLHALTQSGALESTDEFPARGLGTGDASADLPLALAFAGTTTTVSGWCDGLDHLDGGVSRERLAQAIDLAATHATGELDHWTPPELDQSEERLDFVYAILPAMLGIEDHRIEAALEPALRRLRDGGMLVLVADATVGRRGTRAEPAALAQALGVEWTTSDPTVALDEVTAASWPTDAGTWPQLLTPWGDGVRTPTILVGRKRTRFANAEPRSDRHAILCDLSGWCDPEFAATDAARHGLALVEALARSSRRRRLICLGVGAPSASIASLLGQSTIEYREFDAAARELEHGHAKAQALFDPAPLDQAGRGLRLAQRLDLPISASITAGPRTLKSRQILGQLRDLNALLLCASPEAADALAKWIDLAPNRCHVVDPAPVHDGEVDRFTDLEELADSPLITVDGHGDIAAIDTMVDAFDAVASQAACRLVWIAEPTLGAHARLAPKNVGRIASPMGRVPSVARIQLLLHSAAYVELGPVNTFDLGPVEAAGRGVPVFHPDDPDLVERLLDAIDVFEGATFSRAADRSRCRAAWAPVAESIWARWTEAFALEPIPRRSGVALAR